MFNQKEIRESEDRLLACYAMKSYKSRGRTHKEAEHPYRSVYQRDRDRIIHSAAFRRLEYKTQVFVNHEGDYYRTRLTHTLEVAQIARTIATALRLNADLTEAIALAHDLGHTPFGHSGEEALNELMSKHGGFNHNLQGLRVVDILEERYPDFPGLNLTWEVREGIAKHTSAFDRSGRTKEFSPNQMPTLEAQIVDIADEIAYDNHDIDDGLTSGLIEEKELSKILIWRNISEQINKKYAIIGKDIRKYMAVRHLINLQVTDLIEETEKRIKRLKLGSAEEARKHKEKIVNFSAALLKMRKPLRAFLSQRLYRHYRVVRMSNKAKRFIKELFSFYMDNPAALPAGVQKNIAQSGKRRTVCDYIAGMTDRYASDEYKKLFYPYEKV